MIKPVATLDDILHRGDWCAQLQQAWYEHIPLSEKWACAFSNIPGKIYHHHAGNRQSESASHAVCREFILAGNAHRLGLIWLMLRERHLGGTIILADAHIRYSKPISGKPHAVADLGALSGDLDRLARGRKARVQMQVEIFGDETPGAVFEGTYIVLPAKPFGPYEEGGNEEE